MNKEIKQEQSHLAESLIRLLRNLQFSDIRVKNCSDYPEPDFIHAEMDDSPYTPALEAKKNDIVYYFEIITSNPIFLDSLKASLRFVAERANDRWDADFVLVTQYGNKDVVKQWCEQFELPVSYIWEI
jgi:hypothetical protein